ncbi:MAG TPA: alpha/beta fold hydrolase [Rhodanobacteraceae bacterium]|nr:alpha/beta fold hydrolase [Rhodanobacteraceae bacterium]
MSSAREIVFHPPWLLRNPHVQSTLASSGLRRVLLRGRARELESRAREMILDAGDGVRLQGFITTQKVRSRPRGLAVLFHGWEGSVRSTYLLQTGGRLLREGWDVFRLNFRDHGDTHHLNPGLFHSCLLDEAIGAVRELTRMHTATPRVVIGFSLGGNFALRVALRGPQAGLALDGAVAICPVIDPHQGLFSVERAPWFYHAYFMYKWRRSLRRKQRAFPQDHLFAPNELRADMRALTQALVRRHTDFGTLENYLDGYSVGGDALSQLEVPSWILTSRDDPVIPVSDFERLNLPPNVELDISAHGGHCGFISDLRLSSFAEDYIAEKLAGLGETQAHSSNARAAAA